MLVMSMYPQAGKSSSRYDCEGASRQYKAALMRMLFTSISHSTSMMDMSRSNKSYSTICTMDVGGLYRPQENMPVECIDHPT